jgi:hypothetical protein
MKKLAIVITTVTTFFLAYTLPAYAQIVTCNICHLCDIWNVANNIIDFILFVLAFPVLTLVLMVGGFLWLSSGGNPQRVQQGKTLLINALIGLLIAFTGWLIINTIINTVAKGSFLIGWAEFPGCEKNEGFERTEVDVSGNGEIIINQPPPTAQYSCACFDAQTGIATGPAYESPDGFCTSQTIAEECSANCSQNCALCAPAGGVDCTGVPLINLN